MRNLLIALIVLSMTGCGTIRLRYKGEIQTDKNEKAHFTYLKSYDVTSAQSTTCALTAIFLGGACWFYLVMPTVNQANEIKKDADAQLLKTMKGQKFTKVEEIVTQESWSSGEVDARLIYLTDTPDETKVEKN